MLYRLRQLEDSVDRSEFYYQYAASKIQEQNERKQSLEVKARNSIGLSIALLGVAGLMVSNFAADIVSRNDFSWTIIGLTLVFFLWCIALSLRTLYVYEWHINPDPLTLQEYVQNPEYTSEDLLEWAASGMLNAYRTNESTLQGKDALLRWAMAALSFQSASLGGLMLTVWF